MTMNIRKVSWEELDRLVEELSKKIRGNYDLICGIPRGGLIPAVMLSHRMKIPMTMDLIGDFRAGKKILVVDDIADTGHTLSQIFQENMAIATVFAKPTSKCEPDFYAELTTEWIQFPYEIGVDDEISTVNFKDKNASE
jgi:uncharacterized protein